MFPNYNLNQGLGLRFINQLKICIYLRNTGTEERSYIVWRPQGKRFLWDRFLHTHIHKDNLLFVASKPQMSHYMKNSIQFLTSVVVTFLPEEDMQIWSWFKCNPPNEYSDILIKATTLNVALDAKMKEITKVWRAHPLGDMNICKTVVPQTSGRCSDIC